MKLAAAQHLAEAIAAALTPFCERLEIAGSIRRRRPLVNDIDLVMLAREGQTEDLKARCRERCTQVTDGAQNAIFRMRLSVTETFQLDLFFATPPNVDLLHRTPGNFGSLLLCRTGSTEHNIFIVEHAKRLGRKWNPYRGVLDAAGQIIASETEVEIFRALDLEFIPPEKRER